MTLEEMLKFKGPADQLETYDKLLRKAERLKKAIGKLSYDIQDEEDVISWEWDESSEHDMRILNKHITAKKELIIKRDKKIKKHDLVLKQIAELQY